MPRRRRRSPFRALLIVFAVLILLVVGGVGVAVALVDPNDYKPEIIAAVKRATGRDLTLTGPLSIGRSLTPTIEASGVALSNVEGGSRPQMITVDNAEAEIQLWPLLSRRIVITRLVLIGPDLLLERGNWKFTPERSASASSEPSAAPSRAPRGRIVVETVHVRGGHVTWRDGGSALRALDVTRLDATDASGDGAQAKTAVSGDVVLDGRPIGITAETGPLAAIQEETPSMPWPVQVTAQSGSALLSVSGTIAQPLLAQGYTLVIDGAAPDLSALSGLAGVSLPPLHDVHLAGNLTDSGGNGPDLSAVSLRAGTSDLSAIAPGFSLERADLSMPRLDQPVRAGVQGRLAGAPLQLAMVLGAPRTMLSPGAGPFPIDISGQAAGATISVKGGIATPTTLSGLDLALAARVPDLAALSPLVGRTLPALRDLTVSTRMTDGAGGLSGGVVLHDLALAAPQGDVAGEAALTFGPRPAMRATFASKRIDIDGLVAVLRTPPEPSAKPAVAAPGTVPASAPAPAPADAAPITRSQFAISDRPLPWDMLRQRNGDVRWTVDELRSGGAATHDVNLHVVAADGRIALDTAAEKPGPTHGDGTARIDATQAPPTVAVVLHAPTLPLKPITALFGLPDDATGTAEIDADLHGAGQSPHDIAAGLDGHVGLAMVDADVENRLLSDAFGDVLLTAKLPGDLGGSGRTHLRCLAIRLDVAHGQVTANALVLDSTKLLLQGGGTLSLGDEALNLRLRPLLRVSGPGIILPVRIGGTLGSPKFGLDAGGGAEALASLAGRAPPQASERGADACAPALVLARGGRPGATPSPVAPPPQAKLPNAAELLRALGR